RTTAQSADVIGVERGAESVIDGEDEGAQACGGRVVLRGATRLDRRLGGCGHEIADGVAHVFVTQLFAADLDWLRIGRTVPAQHERCRRYIRGAGEAGFARRRN